MSVPFCIQTWQGEILCLDLCTFVHLRIFTYEEYFPMTEYW